MPADNEEEDYSSDGIPEDDQAEDSFDKMELEMKRKKEMEE